MMRAYPPLASPTQTGRPQQHSDGQQGSLESLCIPASMCHSPALAAESPHVIKAECTSVGRQSENLLLKAERDFGRQSQ